MRGPAEVGDVEVESASAAPLRHGCRSGAPMDGFTAWQRRIPASSAKAASQPKRPLLNSARRQYCLESSQPLAFAFGEQFVELLLVVVIAKVIV